MSLREGIKNMLLKILDIKPATDKKITILEPYSFQGQVLKNRLWYIGEPSELEQFFKQCARDNVSRSRFWASVPSDDLSIRKIHSGIPATIVDRLTEIIISDLDEYNIDNEQSNEVFEAIKDDNKLLDIISDAIVETLVTGDGAFKLTIDTDISDYPIVEFYSGEKVDYNYRKGRLYEVMFYTEYDKNNKTYKLQEIYGRGYIQYKLYDEVGKEVPLTTLEETKDIQDVTFNNCDLLLAVPLKFYKSTKFKDRGKSIFDKKSDSFDALDEVISQWIDAIRDGRVNKYIPEDLIPKDPMTGALMKPNSFDNRFIKVGSSLSEDAKNQIDMIQADINYEAFVSSYLNVLDMCLQGIVSPSTLGIDLKKTDNAEAQREKEKATLYTRSKIVDTLNDVLPQLAELIMQTNDLMNNRALGEYECVVTFGEYASPSFDTVVETVGKAKAYGIMSIQKAIDELYGDTMTDEEKQEEIERIREESGVVTLDEMTLGSELDDEE